MYAGIIKKTFDKKKIKIISLNKTKENNLSSQSIHNIEKFRKESKNKITKQRKTFETEK